MRPHRRQPTRLPRPRGSPGKNNGVGCHFLLQCMKLKTESEVAQSCLTLSDPMDCSLPGSRVHGICQARVLEWGAIAFSYGRMNAEPSQSPPRGWRRGSASLGTPSAPPRLRLGASPALHLLRVGSKARRRSSAALLLSRWPDARLPHGNEHAASTPPLRLSEARNQSHCPAKGEWLLPEWKHQLLSSISQVSVAQSVSAFGC